MPKRALEIETEQITKKVGFIMDPQTLFVSLVRHAATYTPFLIVKDEEGKLPLVNVTTAIQGSVPHTIILGKDVSTELAKEMVGSEVLDKWESQEFDKTISFKSPDFEGQEIHPDELLAIDLIKKGDKELGDSKRILLLLYKKEGGPMPKQTDKEDMKAQEKQVELKKGETTDKADSAAGDVEKKPDTETKPGEQTDKGSGEAATEDKDKKKLGNTGEEETTATTEVSKKATWDVRDDIGSQIDAMAGLIWGAFNVQSMKKAARKGIITSALSSFESFVVDYLAKIDESSLNNIVVGEKSEKTTLDVDPTKIQEGMTALLDALKPLTELLTSKSEKDANQHTELTQALGELIPALEKGFGDVSDKVDVLEDKVVEWSRLPNTPAGDRSISDEGIASISGARERAKKGNVFKGIMFSHKKTAE